MPAGTPLLVRPHTILFAVLPDARAPQCMRRALAVSSSAANDTSFRRVRAIFRIIDECLLFGDTVTKITSPCTTRNPKQQRPIFDRIAWHPAMVDVVFM